MDNFNINRGNDSFANLTVFYARELTKLLFGAFYENYYLQALVIQIPNPPYKLLSTG